MKFTEIYKNLTAKRGYNKYEFSLQINKLQFSSEPDYYNLKCDTKIAFLKSLQSLQQKYNDALLSDNTSTIYITAYYRSIVVYEKKIVIKVDTYLQDADQRADWEEERLRKEFNS